MWLKDFSNWVPMEKEKKEKLTIPEFLLIQKLKPIG
jgi:hypothetical protein